MDSMSCSKLSKAVSLEGRAIVGSWIMLMDSRIRSASEGPPSRAWRVAGSIGRGVGAGEEGSEAEAEASIDHLRRLFI